MIDNFEQIKSLLKFDSEQDFYFLQIIARKKDHKDNPMKKLGTNNNSRLIKAYYIFSTEQLDEYKDEIIELCKLFKARAGISLNRRNSRDLSLEMLALLANNIKNNHFNQLSKLYNTICGQHHSEKDKTWILDVDTKDNDFVNKVIEDIKTIEPEGDKLIAKIETKNGYHLITRSFNSQKFGMMYPEVELHKNNPTILYIP